LTLELEGPGSYDGAGAGVSCRRSRFISRKSRAGSSSDHGCGGEAKRADIEEAKKDKDAPPQQEQTLPAETLADNAV
jgi:hypothetical protein